MAEVRHGNASPNQLEAAEDKTQVYGLGENDSLKSEGKKDVLLVGGSGNDTLYMKGGNGTLSGGAGADIFVLTYSANETLSAIPCRISQSTARELSTAHKHLQVMSLGMITSIIRSTSR